MKSIGLLPSGTVLVHVADVGDVDSVLVRVQAVLLVDVPADQQAPDSATPAPPASARSPTFREPNCGATKSAVPYGGPWEIRMSRSLGMLSAQALRNSLAAVERPPREAGHPRRAVDLAAVDLYRLVVEEGHVEVRRLDAEAVGLTGEVVVAPDADDAVHALVDAVEPAPELAVDHSAWCDAPLSLRP